MSSDNYLGYNGSTDLFGMEIVEQPQPVDLPEVTPVDEAREIATEHRDQIALFDDDEALPSWADHWIGMPEYDQQDLMPWQSIKVHFTCSRDRDAFAQLVGQRLTDLSQWIWYPKAERLDEASRRYRSERTFPKYPLYIVSKGRAESRLTNRALSRMGIDHYIIVEEPEADLYRTQVESATVLVLPPAYKSAYEVCDDLGMTKSTGPGPARNFAWDHSTQQGHAWHWVMDDNIERFRRLNNNTRIQAETPAIFAAMEAFCERYSNVGMAGPNYTFFAKRKQLIPPYTTNTRIYSCNLIRNDVPLRWRGRYNEDTDLSLRMLKAKWCTVQFNAFLQDKQQTQLLAGGNTADFYAKEGTKPKSDMLAALHPDVCEVSWKFDRWHHQVDYTQWKRMKLQRKPDAPLPAARVDNLGMVLEQCVDAQWVSVEPRRNGSDYFTPEDPP